MEREEKTGKGEQSNELRNRGWGAEESREEEETECEENERMKARRQRMKRLVGKGEKDERGRREERGKWWVNE